MRPCCVPGCTDRKSRRHDLTVKLAYRNIWIDRINNSKLMNLDLSDRSYKICGIHFEDVCKNSNGSLRHGCLPTLHLPDYKKGEDDCFFKRPPSPDRISTYSSTLKKIEAILSLKPAVTKLTPVGTLEKTTKTYSKKGFNEIGNGSENIKCESSPTSSSQISTNTEYDVDTNLEDCSYDLLDYTEECTRIIFCSPKTIKEENSEKCRTCLNSVFLSDSSVFTDLQKEMLSRCVPEIEVVNTDHICGECSKRLETSYHFITQCQKVEVKLKQEQMKSDFIEQNVNDEQRDTVNSKSVCQLQNKVIKKDNKNKKKKDEATVDETFFDANNEQDNLAEKIQYKLKEIRTGFPNLNIAPSTELDHDYNIVATNTGKFTFKKHLNVILSLPYEKDVPLPEKRFDISSSRNAKKRVLLLSINARHTVSCYYCLRELKHPTLMEKHKKRCGKYILKCGTCNKGFFNKAMLREHKKCHRKPRCTKCKIQFANKDEYKTHKYYCEKRVTCCDQKFQTRKAYLKHCYLHHWNREKFLCDICGKSFKTSGNLYAHKKTHTAPVACSICKRVFKNKMAYSKHVNFEHHNYKRFVCEHCGLVLNRKDKLRNHVETHDVNRIRKYKCELCPKQFYTNPSLSRHILLKHTYQGNLKYACDKCDERFSRSDYLKRHIAQHMREANRFNAKTREI